MKRPEYPLKLVINEKQIDRVIIDQHYREKHAYLNDRTIMEMVGQLNGQNFPIEETHGAFQYFRVEPVYHDDKPHRLILLLCVADDFLGVVNAFRVARRKW
ncbi:MAG: hypothetical protein HZA03_02180 [Nitrospinae bacterium]|nr:hypothetical protein [Nitrospinota bacterium]